MTEMYDRFDPSSELSDNVRNRFFIDGQWRDAMGSERLELVSPLTEDVFLDVPAGSEQDMDAAISAATVAFEKGPWPRMAPIERGDIIRKMGEELVRRSELLGRLWTAQVGAPVGVTQAYGQAAPNFFAYYADLSKEYAFEDVRPTYYGHAKVVREPVGVCALIVPWNAPLLLLSQKLAAGLLAGCTFVVKPSPETPLEALVLAECAEAAGLPAGVLNIVPAGRDVGEALVRDVRTDKVSFTGSTAAGKQIAAICADRVARVSLELGGKSAAIICDDADLTSCMASVTPISMPFTGQVCFAQTRVLVSDKRHDEVVEAYSRSVEAIKMGDPWDPQTTMGPLSIAKQRDRVLSYIETGRKEGAKLIAGGGRGDFNRGFFVEPTIFDDVEPGMTIFNEEVFGPVVSITRYRDEEDAINIANSSIYGLSGMVFTSDMARGEKIARSIRTGHVAINAFQLHPSVPLGGFKQSGLGREGGPEGLEEFLETKAIFLPTPFESENGANI